MASPITLPDFGSGENTEVVESEPVEVEDNSDVSIESAASPFLKNIPDQDKAIVAKYIKGWDGEVTKKFQGIHDQYKDYKELGDIDVVKRSMEIVALLQNDPKSFHKNLTAFIDQMEGKVMPDEDEFDDEAGSDDSEESELVSLRRQVEELTNNFTNDVQSRQEKADIDALDRELEKLHTKHGDFDDDWVLVQVSRGTPIEKAIEAFNQKFGGRSVGSQKSTPPKILTGTGSRDSSGQVDPSKLDKDKRKEYIASVLEAAANS